jgi:hypothetical protein
MLPMVVVGDYDHLIIEKAIQHWFVYYSTDRQGAPRTNKSRYMKTADTEADARAKMLVYLLENQLIASTPD